MKREKLNMPLRRLFYRHEPTPDHQRKIMLDRPSGWGVTPEERPLLPVVPRAKSGKKSRGLKMAKNSTFVHDLYIALLGGLVVGGLSIAYQSHLDNQRQDRADEREDQRQLTAARQEDLRFIRERSSEEIISRPFAGIDLKDQNLTGLQLKRSDFSESNLSGAEMALTELNRAMFFESDLTEANLSGSGLQDAAFRQAHLTSTEFRFADLPKVSFIDSYLNHADFTAANLRNAVFQETVLNGANLTFSDLRGADLEKAYFQQIHLDKPPAEPRNILTQKIVDKYTGICYNEQTVWPSNYEPPLSNEKLCNLFDEENGPTDEKIDYVSSLMGRDRLLFILYEDGNFISPQEHR